MKSFRVNGHLFRVNNKNELEYFMPNFDPLTGLNGLGGFWKTLGKVAGVAAIGYAGYSLATGTGSFTDRVSQTVSNITTGVSNLASKVGQFLPSGETIAKAAGVAVSILGARQAMQQGGMIGIDPATGLPSDPAMQSDSGIFQGSGNQPVLPSGFKTGIDTTSMMLIGGGALVLLLALRK